VSPDGQQASGPVRARRSVKTLTIDGMEVAGREDQTILEVAEENGVEIPTLCHLDGLTSIGACRMCLVELKGNGKMVPACTSLVDEGMEVLTRTERLTDYKRKILELFFSERNHICAVCVSNGDCELQDLAEEFEPTETTIRNWIKQADRDEGKSADGLSTDEREELRELRKKLRQLQQERDILAKATAWFAREKGDVPPKSSGS